MRALVLIAALTAPLVAHADDEIVQGNVIKIEADELYISIGVDKGVSGGSSVRLKRPVSLKHPVTRATVKDWIPIGSASVTQAGSVMSRAVVGDLVVAVKVGDIAEVLVDRPDRVIAPTTPTTPVPLPTTPATPQAPPVDQATSEVLGLFAAQSNQSIDSRIAAWERYLSMRASSPYAASIRRDLDQLHALRDQLRPPRTSSAGDVAVNVEHSRPSRSVAGSQIPVVFVLEQPQQVASAYLHYRPRGNRTYRSLLLVREHDIYLRGTVPAEAVTAPGVDYFVEVSTPDGRSGLAVGTPLDPVAVDVAKPTVLDQFGSAPGRSSVKLAMDYLDFSTFDKREGTADFTDRMVTANVDFTYRLDSVIESLGVGYGVFSGAGGRRDPLPTMTDAERAAFHYGYADIELGGDQNGVHLAGGGKLIAGVGKDRGDGGFGLGVEGRFRIGHRDRTNLAFIARTIERIGFLTDVRFGSRLHERVLLGVSVGATNQPLRRDVGVKLGTELEVLASKNVSVILRGSWQGRATYHGGLGGGGGLGFYW